jgi:hypothetical protein
MFHLKINQMITEKSMRAAAKELNDVLGLDPVIDTKAKLSIVTDGVKSALPLIDPKNDEFTDATQAVIDELNGAEEEEDETPKKKAKKPAKEEEEDEPEADEPEEDSLIDQVNAAPLKLSVMTAFVKENAELKPLVKKLATFEKASVLKAAILALLEPEEAEEEEEEEEVAPVKKGKKTPVEEEEEEEEEAPKKKGTGKGKPASFTGTKETLGTNRMIECAKACAKIKGSQTIDAIATIADAAFVKVGGSANVKQSKSIIKGFLHAAKEWGIVTEKGGKLTNP